MGIFDYFKGGNTLVAAKSICKIFAYGLSDYETLERAYRYTYIFRNNTIAKHAKYGRDFDILKRFQQARIRNCTDIAIATLAGAAPKNTDFHSLYYSFGDKTSLFLKEYGIPEQYIYGDNRQCIGHIAEFISHTNVVTPQKQDELIKSTELFECNFDLKEIQDILNNK